VSYTIHDAIIVTTHEPKGAEAARTKAVELGLQATNVVISDPNGWCTFHAFPVDTQRTRS